MKQPTVLVVSDQGEFAQTLMSRWHSERTVPAFTVMNSEVFHANAGQSCDLIIVGPVARQRFSALMTLLATLTQPVIVVAGDAVDAMSANSKSARIMVLRQHEGWVDLLILLSSECLRRLEATERAEKAEQSSAELAGQAMLGRYMLDMRHSLNNALTSVLGNAELLLLEPGNFSEEVRDQLATIRTMSLRMNEILARFSSLETELTFAKRDSQREPLAYVRSNAAGWSTF
ncbi:histidine kinase A-like protein [Candidatus Koribacter versatilis Ellin345]|uniref:histidine kinase n=1 Tax=Koribacter versatilis (strain Ellin345) TaxID=204669 RepID=Q1IQR8_KORVE|nr:histidine kinase dimerization/phospho-acceptor domain-containing protein [Candidatus Koribacter versatilis]ABF40782.1 histidine kinase A-like protein [Candidatus Koribacter versatilis Ellin345]